MKKQAPKAPYSGWKILLKIDLHVLLALLLLGYCWLWLDTMSIKLSAHNKINLSFYELLKFINGDAGFLRLDSASAGFYGVMMWVVLLLPLVHCWYSHRYTLLACAAPLGYMVLCAVGVYAGIMHKAAAYSDLGALFGHRGRQASEKMVSDVLSKAWEGITLESGLYIGLLVACYLAFVGMVKLVLRKRRLAGSRAVADPAGLD